MDFASDFALLNLDDTEDVDDDVASDGSIDEDELDLGLSPAFAALAAPIPSVSSVTSAAAGPPPAPLPRRTKKKSASASASRYRRHVDTNVVSMSLGRLGEAVEPATGDPVFCKGEGCGAMLSTASTLTDATGAVIAAPTDPTPSASASASGPASASAIGRAAASALGMSTVIEADDESEDTTKSEAEIKAAIAAAAAAPAPAPAPAPAAAAAATPASSAPSGAGAGSGAGACPSPDDDTITWVCEFCGFSNALVLDREEIPTESQVDYLLTPAPAVSEAGGGAGGSPSVVDTSLVVFCIDISGSMCVTSEAPGTFALKGANTAKEFADLLGEDGPQQLPGQARNVTYVSRLQAVQAAVGAQIEALARDHPNRRVSIITFNGDVTILDTDGSGGAKSFAGDRLSQYDYLVTQGASHRVEKSISDSSAKCLESLYSLSETGPTALGPAVVVAVSMAAGSASGGKVVLTTDGLANVGLGSLETDSEEAAGKVGEFYERVGVFAASRGVTIDVIGIKGDGCALEHLGSMSDATGGQVSHVDPLKLQEDFHNILAAEVLATKVSATLLLHNGMQFLNVVGQERAEAAGTATNKLVREFPAVTADSEVGFEFGMRPGVAKDAFKGVKALPFQLQIRFTKPDGSECIRCVTNRKPVTTSRVTAEAAINTPVLSAHAAQMCASTAQAGDYRQSRVSALAYGRLLQRTGKSAEQRECVAQYVDQVGQLERTLAAEEEEEAALGMSFDYSRDRESTARARKGRRAKKDSTASALFSMKRSTASSFTPSSRK